LYRQVKKSLKVENKRVHDAEKLLFAAAQKLGNPRLAALASQLQQQPHADYPTPSIALASGEGQTYRVAIIGAKVSGRGGAAARAYHAHPRCQIVGLCDVFPERTAELAETLGVPESAQFVDLDEMISTVKPDLVAIPTGTSSHYSVAKRVLEHGVHIEVEKPMCGPAHLRPTHFSVGPSLGITTRCRLFHRPLVAAPAAQVLQPRAGRRGPRAGQGQRRPLRRPPPGPLRRPDACHPGRAQSRENRQDPPHDLVGQGLLRRV